MKFFHSFKEWMGAQTYVTVKRLYKEPKLVRWGKPSIWLSNTDPRLDMDPSDASWMEDNAVFIDISNPIFRASTE